VKGERGEWREERGKRGGNFLITKGIFAVEFIIIPSALPV
jgi:hypothetical protein